MAAQLYYLPFAAAAKPTNIGVPGAKAYFYAPGSTTLRPVYATSALTTQLPNPVIADGAGRFPPIYLDNTLTYKHAITDRLGANVITPIDPYIPGTAPDASSLAPYSTAAAASASAASTSATAAGTSATAAAGSALTAASYSASATGAAASAAALLSSVASVPTAGMSLTAASRAALSLLATDKAVILHEAGRDGIFAFDSSNLSAKVTADPLQSLYVAPSSNATGASGAWVREFTGPVEATWGGAATTETAANNYADVAAELATLKALAIPGPSVGNGYNDGSVGLHISAGRYNVNNTISPAHALEISGDLTTAFSGGGTSLTATADVHGIECLGPGCNGTRIKGIQLFGTGGGADRHAINQTSFLNVEDFYAKNWSGSAINADTTVSGGLAGSVYRNIGGEGVDWVLRLAGDNSSACLIDNLKCLDSRFGGLFDSSGTGSTVIGGVINSCGLVPGYATRCVYSGKGYAVAYGQETWCSTNAPSGTTANNTGWIYDTGLPTVASATAPAWTSGLTWYFSAPICSEPADGNVRTTIVGTYVESGLNPLVLSDPSTVVGGQILVSVLNQSGSRHGGYMRGAGSWMLFNNAIQTQGPEGNLFQNSVSVFGVNTGPVQDQDIRLENNNEVSQVSFYRQGTYVGAILTSGPNDAFYDFDIHHFRSKASASLAVLSTSGFAAAVPVTTTSTGIGYATGAGGTSTQATSKSTAAAALNKACGQVTLNAASLAAATIVSFTMANSTIGANDVIAVNHVSGGTIGAYTVVAVASAGTITFYVRNNTAGALGEALVLRFAKINAVVT